MLNSAMDSVVLVKGWKKGANWSFPRGKINMAEDDLDCAVREVYEETGLHLDEAGLLPEDRQVKFIEVNMREQQLRLYVFKDVPMDTFFEPRTRKEISKIEWWKLSDLPAFRKKGQQEQNAAAINANKFYMVAPFLVPLRKWVVEQKKKGTRTVSNNHYQSAGLSHDEFLTEEDVGAESGTQLHYPDASREPDNDSMVDATAALNRLLNVQQPSQDSDMDDTLEAQPSQSTKGSALLALLQSKPTAEQPRVPNMIPHTPLEHTGGQAPMPRTPHHYAPRPPPFSSMPPPPTFPPLPQQNTFSYQQPHIEAQYRQNNQQRGPQMQQQPLRPRENPHHYQSQHLIHPQPLPPTVQRALFTGGPVHSPVVPQPVQQHQAPPPNHAPMNIQNPQFPGLHAPMVPSVRKESPPKLTKHTLALLDAFKRRDQDVADANSPNDLPLRRYAPEQPPVPRHQPQELLADISQVPQAPAASQYMPQNIGSNNLAPNPGMFTTRQSNLDTHKSTLLDLFKSPTATSASPSKPLSATALPPSATPSAVELSAVEPLSTNAATTSALLNDKRTPDPAARDAPIPELNPEANLPYRAMTILSRPSEMMGKEASAPNGPSPRSQGRSQANGKKPSSKSAMAEPPKRSPEKPFQPQILKRPQPGQFGGQEPARPAQPSMPSLPSMQEPSVDHRKPQQTDHRQNLLSLFGKPPAGVQQPTYSPNHGFSIPSADPTLRSRVGSLASAAETPRRPSQAPISPADKGFLLDYLAAAVAKGS